MTVISIKPRSKSLREINVNTTPETRLKDILNEYAKVNKISPTRIKLSKIDETGKSKSKQILLDYKKTVQLNGLQNKDIIYSKDLGPQVSWKFVFLMEYIGPIIINTFFYYAIYDALNVTWTQKVAYMMIMLHFFKREYETTFIHIFSHLTMPLFNLLKNCSHYWILSGLFFGVTIFNDNKPTYNMSSFNKFFFHVRDCPHDQLIAFGLLWAIAELSNLYSHIILRRLRLDGSTGHSIPNGFLFNFITVPNYFTEIVGWLIFAIMTMNWSAWLFLVVSATQMFIWGVKKHKSLKREFPDYPKNRKIIVPFVI